MAIIKVITHSGSFHADDVCAVSVLSLLYKKNGSEIEVTRTRDAALIAAGDIVLDVGGKYDDAKFFDHHQQGGAGARPNGIPYASFGLIWKHFGEEYCGSKNVAEKFDKFFVQGVDAVDNGVNITESKYKDVFPVSLNSIVMSFVPFFDEGENKENEQFMKAVDIFSGIIERYVSFLKKEEEAKALVIDDYEKAADKRIIILKNPYPFQETLSTYKEPLFVIYKSPQSDTWHVKAVSENMESFKVRKSLPEAWAGKNE
jgi:uncharacterized UPF0160 family protein